MAPWRRFRHTSGTLGPVRDHLVQVHARLPRDTTLVMFLGHLFSIGTRNSVEMLFGESGTLLAWNVIAPPKPVGRSEPSPKPWPKQGVAANQNNGEAEIHGRSSIFKKPRAPRTQTVS